jgi:hypothetical protein
LKRSRSVALVSVVAGILVFGSCGGGGGGQPPFNATPIASGLFPSVITAGSDAFQMAVTGTGFISDSKGVTFINWNGSPRSSTFNSITGQIVVQISAADVASANSVTVTATNPAPGGGTSVTGPTFTIEPVVPGLTITSLDPASQKAAGNAFSLTVNGTGFTQGDVINWNGTELITTVPQNQSTQVMAQVSQDLIATAGTASVSVSQADQTVATKSTTFTITGQNNLAPDVSSLSPSSTTHGGGDFELRISGSNFAPTAFVLWNGGFRATAFISSSQVVAYIQAADIANSGNATVAVTNPAPGGGTSSNLMFKID